MSATFKLKIGSVVATKSQERSKGVRKSTKRGRGRPAAHDRLAISAVLLKRLLWQRTHNEQALTLDVATSLVNQFIAKSDAEGETLCASTLRKRTKANFFKTWTQIATQKDRHRDVDIDNPDVLTMAMSFMAMEWDNGAGATQKSSKSPNPDSSIQTDTPVTNENDGVCLNSQPSEVIAKALAGDTPVMDTPFKNSVDREMYHSSEDEEDELEMLPICVVPALPTVSEFSPTCLANELEALAKLLEDEDFASIASGFFNCS